MQIDGWKYYNHAAVPTTAPHEPVNMEPIKNGEIWKTGGALLARWTSDWDCGYETEWWYCIKDTPFDISALKSKRRYEINKGNKNFEISEITPAEYAEELFKIATTAYETYPVSYRPVIEHDSFIERVRNWKYYKTYGAFEIESGQLCGYANLLKDGSYINFAVLKVFPEQEKLAINAAIVSRILVDHEEFLRTGGYICDGSRNILHETAFQDYLEKYFEFRKAYCKLHVIYKPAIKVAVGITYPFRRILKKLDGINAIKKINVLLRMEEINRSFE